MATYREIMDAAHRAHNAGAPAEDVQRLLQMAQDAAPGPAPVVPDPAEVAAVLDAEAIAAQPDVDKTWLAERTAELVIEQEELSPLAEQPEVLARAAAQAARELASKRERVIHPGAEEPVSYDPEALPPFRPTRIEETAEGRLYVDPITGERHAPTATEEIVESFAQQPVLGAEAAEGQEPLEILARKEAAGGLVETSFGALLRSLTGYAEATIGEAYWRGLGYEVDAQGEPVDPEDFGLVIAELREKLGIPAVITAEKLAELMPGPFQAPAEALSAELVKHYPRLALGMPAPGVAYTKRTAWSLDPEGRRVASEVEVPDPLTDLPGFLEAEAKRIAQNVAVGRTLGDEFRDTPALAQYYDKVWGDPDAAYWGGTVASLFTPAGPGVALKAAAGLHKAEVARSLSAAARAGESPALARAGAEVSKRYRQLETALESAGAGAIADRARQLQGAVLELTAKGGQAYADLGAIIQPGAKSDARIAQRIADLVVEASRLEKAQKAAVAERLAGGVGRSGPEAQAAVQKAVLAVAPDRGELAAEMGRQALLNVPDDFVLVTDTIGAPRAHAAKIRKAIEAQTREAIKELGDDFSALPLDQKRVLTEQLKSRIAQQVAPDITRRTRDLSALQVFTDDRTKAASDLLRYRPFATPLGRRLAVFKPGFKLEDTSASAAALGKKLAGAGQTAARQVGRELRELSRTKGASGALDHMLEAQVKARAARLGKTVKDLAREQWDAVLDGLYDFGPKNAATKESVVRALEAAGRSFEELPTVARLQAADRLIADNTALKGLGSNAKSGLRTPDAQKAVLRVLMDQNIKKSLADDAISFEALSQGLGGQWLGEAGHGLDAALGNIRAQEELLGLAEQAPVSVLPRTLYGSVESTSRIESDIAKGGEPLVRFLGAVNPRFRRTLAQVVGQSMAYSAGAGRLNLAQRAKYGYGLPNLPFLVYKGLETPFIMAAQRGVADVARSLPRAGRALFHQLTRRHLTGGGITTADGVRYTPAELLKLGEREGLGITAIESERIATLADDILAEARRVAPETPVWSKMSPFQKGFWTRTAEAAEQSYRQGMFEARLLAGDTPGEAAQAARRAALDYEEVPEWMKTFVGGPYGIPAAATTYKLLSGLVIAGLQDPSRLNPGLKALREHKRKVDPHNLRGDLSSLGIVIESDDSQGYMRIPGAGWVLGAIEIARHADNMRADLMRASRTASESGESIPEVWMEGRDGAVIAYSVADVALQALLDGAVTMDTLSAGLPEKQRREARADSAMWTSALAAQNADPTHTGGQWELFTTMYRPRVVPPPSDLAMPEPYERYWRLAPEGQPHILRGRTPEGAPLYQVIEPSGSGRAFQAAVEAMTPEQIERAVPSIASLVAGTESAFSEQPKVKRVYVPSDVDTWQEALLQQFTDPTGIDYGAPEGVRAAQLARVLASRAEMP